MIQKFTYTLHSLEQGMCWRLAQTLLGKSSSKTSEIYTQVSKQEIGKIKNPCDDFYTIESSTIHTDLESIVKQNKNITEINTPKGVHIY
mgnify:CR=1 FL=1